MCGGRQETGRVKEREEKRKRDKVVKELGQRGREVNINGEGGEKESQS